MLYEPQFVHIVHYQNLFGSPCGKREFSRYNYNDSNDSQAVRCKKACNSTSDVQQLCSPELTTELWDAVLKSEEICREDPLFKPRLQPFPSAERIARVRHHVEHRLENGRANSNFRKVLAAVLLHQLHDGDIIQVSGWVVNQEDKEPQFLLDPITKEQQERIGSGEQLHMSVQLKVAGEPKVEPSEDESQSSSYKKVVVTLEFSGCSLYK